MCTVTYIGNASEKVSGKDQNKRKGNFILTSNRDEDATRSPQNITRIEQEGVEIIFPQDNQAGGSWIACSNDGKMVCLLNGAFKRHARQPRYKRSRGVMVLDFFRYDATQNFIENYDFEGMEAFTKVIYDNGKLFEIRWDEVNLFVKELDVNGQYLWSSATLYNQTAREKRQKWFGEWLENRTDFSLDEINRFHQNGGKWDTWNGFIMNRCDIVQTVSITNIIGTASGQKMIYNDLLRKRISNQYVPVTQLENKFIDFKST